MSEDTTITSFKGFDRNLQCRGFQFAVGQSYEITGKIEACKSGFHACEHPLDVFEYYEPASSRYAVVKQSGDISRHGSDSKIASAKITIEIELSLSQYIQRAVQWVFDRAKPENTNHATGDCGAASSTGDCGAASSTGDCGAASSTGNYGAASSTGYQGAASSTGDYGAASSMGTRGAASSTGKASCAMAPGFEGRAMGAEGCALFLVNRKDDGTIKHAWAGIVGKDGIKPDVWYTLGKTGNPKIWKE